MRQRASIPFLIVGASFLALLSGCARISTGSVGIVKHFNGTISDRFAGPGLHLAVLDTYYSIDTTLTRAKVANMRPKDAHGVSLRDVSVVVTYGLDPDKVPSFYRKTKEMDREPDSNQNTLGLEILQQSVIPYAVQIATEQSDLATISSHLGSYATTIQHVVERRLSELYPGIDPFLIQSVTVPTFELPRSIQAQVNAKAGYLAQMQTIAAERAVIEQRKLLEQDRATVQADALSAASRASGLSPDRIIAWERARAAMTLAERARGARTLVTSGSGK